MPSKGINHSALTLLVEAGAVNSATVLAKGDQWILKIPFGDTEKLVLAKNSGKARIWRKLDTLAKYLTNLGIQRFEIDMHDYDPTVKTLTRPDSAATLKRTHAAHKSQREKDTVFTQEESTVVSKIEESPEKAKISWEERRAKILQQEDPRVK